MVINRQLSYKYDECYMNSDIYRYIAYINTINIHYIDRVHEGERSMDFLSRLELDVPDTDRLESPPTRYESEYMRYSKHVCNILSILHIFHIIIHLHVHVVRARRKSRQHHLPPPEAVVEVEAVDMVEVEAMDVVVDGVEAGGEEGVEGEEELQRTRVGLTGT